MVFTLLVLWGIAYVVPIIKNSGSLIQIRKSLDKLVDFAAVYGDSQPYFRPEKETYTKELTALLRYYPVIKTFVSYPKLSYDQTDEETFQSACVLISKLQMQQNDMRHKLARSLNPLISVKDLVLLPVTVAKELGFNPGKNQSLAIEILAIVISSLFDLFSPEIKALIVTFFENFVHN